MRRESFIRLVKKEYLLFKKKRTESHREFYDAIKSVLDNDDFYFVDSETLQSFYLKAKYNGVGNPIHYNFNKCKDFYLDSFDCQRLAQIKSIDIIDGDEWLCVIPSEWQLCGGFLVLKEAFFLNVLNLSFFMQDDFDVYDGSLNNALVCRGDRSAELLVLFHLTSRGDYFSFLQSYLTSTGTESEQPNGG